MLTHFRLSSPSASTSRLHGRIRRVLTRAFSTTTTTRRRAARHGRGDCEETLACSNQPEFLAEVTLACAGAAPAGSHPRGRQRLRKPHRAEGPERRIRLEGEGERAVLTGAHSRPWGGGLWRDRLARVHAPCPQAQAQWSGSNDRPTSRQLPSRVLDGPEVRENPRVLPSVATFPPRSDWSHSPQHREARPGPSPAVSRRTPAGHTSAPAPPSTPCPPRR